MVYQDHVPQHGETKNITTILNEDSSWILPEKISGALPFHKSAKFIHFIFQRDN